jgi:uncharacterized protein (UPF0332 family)
MSEVDIQLRNHFYATAINCLCYACFHATKALLLTKDLTHRTHSGVVTMLDQHFVLQDLFNKTHTAFYSKLMQERMDEDYNDFMVDDEAEVKVFIEPAKEYIGYIEQLIPEYLNL